MPKKRITLTVLISILGIGILFLIGNNSAVRTITTDLINYKETEGQIEFDFNGVLNYDPDFWKEEVRYGYYVNGIKTEEGSVSDASNKLTLKKSANRSDYGLELFNSKKRYILNNPVLSDIVDKPQENRIVYVPSTENADNKEGFLNAVRNETLNNIIYIVKKFPEDASSIESVYLYETNENNYLLKIVYFQKGEGTKKTITLPLSNEYIWIKFDESFNDHSFLWDDAMISWFMLKTDPLLTETTLDFWYSLQIENGINKGLIPREVRGGNLEKYLRQYHDSYLNLNPVSVMPMSSKKISNPFILSRVELELYKRTGNVERLKKVLPNIVEYYNWIENNRKKIIYQNGKKIVLYSWDSFGSGMDNIKRCSDCGYVDLIAQQAAVAYDLKEIGDVTNNKLLSAKFAKKHQELSTQISKYYYDPVKKYVFDVKKDGTLFTENRTAAGFWALYAHTLTEVQATEMINSNLLNADEFGAKPYFPSVSRSSIGYKKNADYWNGGIWPPIVWLGVLGLQEYGFIDKSHEISGYYLGALSGTYEKYGTLFEYYSPEYTEEGLLLGEPKPRSDFFGWSALPLGLSSY
jgi:glycogen debranching enzyme